MSAEPEAGQLCALCYQRTGRDVPMTWTPTLETGEGGFYCVTHDHRPRSAYTVKVTCQKCGADVSEIAKGSAHYHWERVAHVGCTVCQWHGVVTVTLQDVSPGRKA